ncbi:hypothetical protein [Caudoviricetes sp.]|nr:hypothetical protein [Caudoviricetes sp.]
MEIEDKVSEAEIAEEQDALAEAKEDEVRTKIVSDLGIADDDSNKDLIDKLVTREMDQRGKLSKAIGQKIKLRDQLHGKPPVKTTTSTSKVNMTAEEIAETAAKAAREEYEKRDLATMGHSDKVKDQIKRIAQIQNVSVLVAAQDPYIQSLIEGEKKQQAIDDAAKNGKGRTKIGVTIDVSKPLDVSQFNLSTEEGRAEWEEAKKAKREAAK